MGNSHISSYFTGRIFETDFTRLFLQDSKNVEGKGGRCQPVLSCRPMSLVPWCAVLWYGHAMVSRLGTRGPEEENQLCECSWDMQ